MKRKILTGLSLVLASSATSVFAAQSSDPAALEKSIAQITAQTQELQNEVKSLRAQLSALKKQQLSTPTSVLSTASANKAKAQVAVVPNTNRPAIPQNAPTNTSGSGDFFDQGIVMTTSPFLQYRSAYDGSDTIVNMPSMNQDLGLLQLLQNVEVQNAPQYQTYSNRPLLVWSGKLEGQVSWYSPPDRNASDTSNIDLSSAEIDLLTKVSPWAFGYFTFNYDNSPFNARERGISPSKMSNSRLFLNRGFVTLGDLSQLPFYLTIGQFYQPFGVYSSTMVSTPETQILGRTNSRGVLLGYNQYGINTSIYAFNGDSNIANGGINEFGANVAYQFQPTNNVSVSLGAGYISTLTDSSGLQNTGNNTGFLGFSFAPSTGPLGFNGENVARRVPAMDLNAKVSFSDKLVLMAEYVSALRQFGLNVLPKGNNGDPLSVYDVSYNGHGARPDALHLEANYYFNMWGKPSNVAVAYGHTTEALALNLPASSYTIALNTSLIKNTVFGLEFRHDVNYSTGDFASGLVNTNADGDFDPTAAIHGPGSADNSVIAKLGIYF